MPAAENRSEPNDLSVETEGTGPVQTADPAVARRFQSELDAVVRASKNIDRLPAIGNLIAGFRSIRNGT